jgi:TRAP-type C4-dicarboxylate transport system permease small subunit
MNKIFRPLDWLENAAVGISALSLLLITVLTTIDVFLRKLPKGKSITSLYEITEEYLMVMVVFLALSYVYKIGGHVRVTMITDRFIPSRFMAGINKVLNFVYLGFFVIMTYQGFLAAVQAWKFGEVSSTILAYPLAPALFMVPLGAFLVCLRIVQNILCGRADTDTKPHSNVEQTG